MSVTGRYKALRKIADGGTAEVFLAEQVGAAGFRRLVVLKRIRPELYADAQFRKSLVEEALVTMGLHHSNLVEVLDLGEAQGRYFLVLELVDGWTLQQLVHRAKQAKVPLPPSLAVYVVAEVCRALSYAHERTRAGEKLAIVHRDVCPNNVLVSDTGEVKLTDFGIAKARIKVSTSEVGMVAGKPSYMSPEQACGESVDARSDLFSLGTLLYSLLTFELPFKAPSDRELLMRVASGEFVSPAKLQPSLPKELVKVVLTAMKRERAERFQSAQQMLAALEKVQRGGALPPFGRSELEAWLKGLTQKDGKVPVTRESMVPTPAEKGPDAEWIQLSSDEHPVLPPKPPRAKGTSRLFAVLAALAALGLAGAWWLTRAPTTSADATPVTKVATLEPMRPPLQPLPVAVAPVPEVADAGSDEPTSDAGEPEASLDAGEEALAAAVSAEAPDAGEPAPAEPEAPPPAGESPAQAEPLLELKVSGRLSPTGSLGDRLAVQLDSEPKGAKVLVDHRELGTTPTVLRFKAGITFELTFVKEGAAPLVQWLTLVEREGRRPYVSLKAPPKR